MRREKDALGEVLVPEDRYFGAQTQRASQNFAVGDQTWPTGFLRAHALVKKAAAQVNNSFGDLPDDLCEAICSAADEVTAGKLDDHFPLRIWQSGSGTQTNMNVNEVIANRACEILGQPMGKKEPVHPNNHVNMAQSTNDTVPTTMRLASVLAVEQELLPVLQELEATLQEKAAAFEHIVKIGRTHLQDATPLTLGQEFSGYAAQVRLGREAIQGVLPRVRELPIGGTAVGTGINTKAGYDTKMCALLAEWTKMDFVPARNRYAHMASHDVLVELSGAMRSASAGLMKIANDLRWLGSGPRSGLGEINLPANEPGSSIMPGKINPTQCEMLTQVVCQVYGNDTTVAFAGSQGNFELNVFNPVIIYNVLQSCQILSDAVRSFNAHCVSGIEPNHARIKEHLENSLMLVTALNPHIGYDKAAEIALKAWREESTLKQTAVNLGYLTEDQFDAWVKPEDMVSPEE